LRDEMQIRVRSGGLPRHGLTAERRRRVNTRMLRIFSPGENGATCVTDCDLNTLPAGAVWIDMLSPTPEEERFVEDALGVLVPTRDEMIEIEPSSRLYQENGALYVTATLVAGHDTDDLHGAAVSFVLTPAHLITVRYATPKVFDIVKANFERSDVLTADPAMTLVQLLDGIVDRLADVLEHTGGEMDHVSAAAFRRAAPGARKARLTTVALQSLLSRIGHIHDVVSKARDSALTLARLVGYLTFAIDREKSPREHLKSLQRDIAALTDHANYLGNNVTFLLDAVLGLINLEQTNVTKIFSVAALVFLPPTLVAGIYGMNFAILPELKWHFGYAWALGLMLFSAVTPYMIFRWRGWL